MQSLDHRGVVSVLNTVWLVVISICCTDHGLLCLHRFGANDAATRATAATATASERVKEGMAGGLAAMKRLNLGFKRSSQQES